MANNENKMERVFSMWKNQSKSGVTYYSGKHDDKNLVGYINGKKKNPNEPDIRIFAKDEDGNFYKDSEGRDVEYLALWQNKSKKGTMYLTGKFKGKRVVGFKPNSKSDKAPAFALYFSDEPKKPETENLPIEF